MNQKPALGKGLGSLIPQKPVVTLTEQVLPEARKEILEVNPGDIKENPRQPRHFFAPSELEDLMSSIKEHGILQPLIVTRRGGGYELIAGERRLRSARALGLSSVPVIVREADEQTSLEIALIENIQRQDLNAVEEAIAYKALMEEFHLRQEDVAARVGKSRSNVANIVRLLDLPQEILDALKEEKITKSHARTLLAETDPQKRQVIFQQLLNGGVTVREVEARVTGLSPKKRVNKSSGVADPNIAAHEKRLREILGTKVDITESNGKGKIEITFYSREELMDLLQLLSDKK